MTEAPDTRTVPAEHWACHPSAKAAGWSEPAMVRAREYAATLDTASVLLVQGGRIVEAWGDIEHKYGVFSMRKSFLNALFGIYAEDGTIHLGMTLETLGIDDKEGLTAVEKRATVRDLLAARSGVYHPTGGESAWMKSMREPRGSHGPGTWWVYNNWDFNALGTIFEQETGLDLFAAFRDDVATKIGMEDFRYDDEVKDAWRWSVKESVHAMFTLRMSSRDLARFGLLYLRQGRWGGEQVVPGHWVRESLLPYSAAGLNGAYGFLWWLSRDGIHWPGVIVPEGTFSARGYGGHRLVVVPPLDLVFVHRVDNAEKPKEVTSTQFGRLLALILEAAGA